MINPLGGDLARASAMELAAAVRSRTVSALELTDAAISRIETRDRAINAVVVRDFDRGRDQARQVDLALAKGDRLPLGGVPMTVKECYNVAGLPTTFGFRIREELFPCGRRGCGATLERGGRHYLGKDKRRGGSRRLSD